MADRYLYVIFASTPYKIGKMIRMITGEKYNHACISLNQSLEPMYGFARRYLHTPLYGGFVEESLSRYHVNGKTSHIRVCRLELSEEQYEYVTNRLDKMIADPEQYPYNLLSAMTAPFHKTVKVRDSYICVEFVVDLLKNAGVPLKDQYYTVGRLEEQLGAYEVYTGTVPEASEYDSNYYAKHPVRHPIQKSLGAFFTLFGRLEM